MKGIHHGHFTSEFLFPGNPLVDWLPVVRNGERGWKKTRGTEGWLNWTGVVFLTSTHPRELEVYQPHPRFSAGMKDE